MTFESEAGTCARWWNLKLIDDLFPEFVICDALESAPQNHLFKQFAKVEFFAANLGYFEIIDSQISLELN